MNNKYSFNFLSLVFCIVLAMTLLGCEKSLTSPEDIAIVPMSRVVAHGNNLNVRVVNPTRHSIYFRRCGANSYRFRVIKLSGDDETQVKPDSCTSFNQAVIEVKGGDTMEISLPLNFNFPGGVSIPGNYVVELQLTDTMNRFIEPPRNRSEQFEMRRP